MSAQSIIQQVRWQDLKVRSEADVVFELAKREGWDDCEIFGHGDMITQPMETTGWKLIPADLYEGSIPAEGIGRVRQIVDAGVRIKGIIIADDERKAETPPEPSKPKILLSITAKASFFLGKAKAGSAHARAGLGKALTRLSQIPTRFGRALATGVGQLLAGIGKVLLKLFNITVVVSLIALAAYMLIHFPLLLIVPGFLIMIGSANATLGTRVRYDPKLVVLVDDETGNTVWVSVLTWYD